MSKVSIIIPVYNSEKYLCKCLDSVIKQTLTDIEIVCIDDCSLDSSKNLLEKYAQTDERIKVLYNDKNKGQSFSRNRAIEFSKGEYIQFLDSDDYLSGEDVLEKLYSLSVENKLDLLKSRIVQVQNGRSNRYFEYAECIVGSVCSGKELLYKLAYNHMYVWNTTSNFIRKNFLIENKISFYNGILHEDVLYSYELYYYAKRAMCVNQCTYVYVKRENSTTTQQTSINHLRGYLIGMNEILKKDFMNPQMEFRYATMMYFIRMYHNASEIRKKLKCSVETGILDDTIKRLSHMFAETNYVNMEIFIQNISTIVQSEKLYIYGAGRAAAELIEILDGHDIPIDGVFVTDINSSSKTLLGHRVLEIDNFVHSGSKELFLVAITKKYIENIVELLHSKGIENIICLC